MQAALPPLPMNRGELSPVDSEWSGVNAYGNFPRNESSSGFVSPQEDFMTSRSPPFRPQPPNAMNSFGSGSMSMSGQLEPINQRGPSEAGSRGSSRAGSIANSRSSDGTLSDHQSKKYKRMETELFQHYTVLKSFLRGGAQPPPRPNKARDKLLRLSPVQFHELSTDVFDELQRRQASSPLAGRPPRLQNVPPFLQPRPDFHEKRNQARQKLSSLQAPRFRDLSTDVFCELERRFPQFSMPPSGNGPHSRSQSRGPGSGSSATGLPAFPAPQRAPTFGTGPPQAFSSRSESISSVPQFDNPPPVSDYGRPMPKQFQSNTITPNKSMMVEDEDDSQPTDSRYDRSSDAFGLESSLTSPRSDRDTSATSQSGVSSAYTKTVRSDVLELQDKVSDLEAALELKENNIRELNSQSQEWETTKKSLDRKLEDAENLNKSLQLEIEKLKAEQPHYSGENVLWKTKYLKLDQDHAILQGQLTKQRELTDEVSRQGQHFLEEMRAMAESGIGSSEREEALQSQVHKLEEEVKEWKGRYVKAKTQLRSVRASSLGLSISRPDAARHGAALQDQNGLVKDVHVTKFQIAIDELLRIARSENPSAVLDHMKVVVLAVRGITSDIDAAAVDKDDDEAKRRTKLKSKVSATANNLITASKNFASAQGLSPVSLVDAAASHLTAAVVDLLHHVKIRPTPAGELDEGDEPVLEPLQANGYFNIAESLRRRSAVDSVYSALSSPSDVRTSANQTRSSLDQRNGASYADAAGLGIKSTAAYATSQEEADLEDLKMYLEDQTDGLVQSVTSLVDSIRGDAGASTVQDHVLVVASTVENIINSVERTGNEPSSYKDMLASKTGPVLKLLQECRDNLLRTNEGDGRESTQKLPPLAFQIARETKELVSRIMSIEVGREEDFS